MALNKTMGRVNAPKEMSRRDQLLARQAELVKLLAKQKAYEDAQPGFFEKGGAMSNFVFPAYEPTEVREQLNTDMAMTPQEKNQPESIVGGIWDHLRTQYSDHPSMGSETVSMAGADMKRMYEARRKAGITRKELLQGQDVPESSWLPKGQYGVPE